MKHGKKYLESKKLIEENKLYDPAEAISLVKQTGKAKFDETVELSIRLGVDPRHAEQQVRGQPIQPTAPRPDREGDEGEVGDGRLEEPVDDLAHPAHRGPDLRRRPRPQPQAPGPGRA